MKGFYSNEFQTAELGSTYKNVFSKIIDVFDDGYSGIVWIKECTNAMKTVNIKISLDNYSNVTILSEKIINCGEVVPFSIPTKSLGNIFEIYISSNDKRKGSITGLIL